MTTKQSAKGRVNFYATARLFDAYQNAEHRNKNLSDLGTVHKLWKVTSHTAPSTQKHNRELVVLSHANDVIEVENIPLLPHAFCIVFYDNDTHPNQLARWVGATNIRAENRLQVVKVDDLNTVQVSNLLGRVCLALARDGTRGSIIYAYLTRDALVVRGPKNRVLHVPIDKIPALKKQPQKVLRHFEIDPDGSFLYWPDIDVHLGWSQLLQAVDPAELHKAQQRSTDFNQRYGAAVRRLREQAGLSQSEVAGLTDRQLRRIETGECRATSNALHALAKAHGVSVNAYMESVAREMSQSV